jgi:hypothetical protein
LVRRSNFFHLGSKIIVELWSKPPYICIVAKSVAQERRLKMAVVTCEIKAVGGTRSVGVYELDIDRVPSDVKTYFAVKALRIATGTEAGAATLAKVRKHLANGDAADSVTVEQVAKWKEKNPDQFYAWQHEAALAKIEAIYAGTYGQERESTPAYSPVEAKARSFAEAEVRAELAKGQFKLTRKYDDPIKGLRLPDVEGPASLNLLIERRLNGRHSERLMAAAEKAVAAERKRVEAATKDAGLEMDL